LGEYGERRRDRRAVAKEASYWAGREADAQRRWHSYVSPEAARLDNQIAHDQHALDLLNDRQHDLRRAEKRVQAHGVKAGQAARQLNAQLDDCYRSSLDGVPTAPAMRAARHQAYPRPSQRAPEPTRRLGADL